MTTNKYEYFSCRMNDVPKMREALNRVAKAKGMLVSAMVERALKDYIAKEERKIK